MSGFKFVKSLSGENDIPVQLEMGAGVTITAGDGLEFGSGKLARANGQTDVLTHVAVEGKTSTSGTRSLIRCLPTASKIFSVVHTPLVNGTAAQSNSSTTTVKVALADGSSSDLVGALVYIPELDEYATITANSYTSNVVTITVGEAFSRAVTTGDTVRVLAFGFGAAPKLDSSTPYKLISNVRADATGGKTIVRDITVSGPKALKELFVEFLQA